MRFLYLTVGAVFGIALVAACGRMSNPVQMLADMGLLDDMEMRGDQSIIGVPDAKADPGQLYSAICDKISTRTTTVGMQTYKTSEYFAEFHVSGLSPRTAQKIETSLCDYEQLGEIPQYYHFTDDPAATGYKIAGDSCSIGIQSWVNNDTVAVFCGSLSDTPSGKSGYRAKNVYLRVN